MKSRAAVKPAQNEPLIVDDIEIPDPQPGQMTLKLFSSGICHSQLHQMHQPDWPHPLILGHEATGVVTQIGRNVTHVKEGDHAIVTWVPRVSTDIAGPPAPLGVTYREQPVGSGASFTWSEETIASATMWSPYRKKTPPTSAA